MKFFKSLKGQATGFLEQYKQKDPATLAAAQQAVGGLLILDGFIGIDNPFANKNRPGIFGTLGVMAFATLFMFVPTFFSSLSGMDKMTAETQGQVSTVGAPQTSTDSDGNRSTTCTFVAKYTVDGRAYESPSSSSSSSYCQYTAGQSVTINYNPENPAQWMGDRAFVMNMLNIFFFVGLFFFLTGLVTFVIRLVSIIFGWKILRSGRALAKTLPNGPDLGATIDVIKKDFTKIVFGFNDAAPATPILQSLSPTAPVLTSTVPTPSAQTPAQPTPPTDQAQPK